MDESVRNALDEGDTASAVELIRAGGEPVVVLAGFHGAIRHAYWERKDIDAVVLLGRAALSFGSGVSSSEDLGALKSVAYDVASFCWTGWDEPGVTIDDEARIFGAEAAGLNLALAERLDRPGIPRAAAHWLVGAHALTAEDNASALGSFEQAASLAKSASAIALELLYRGYAAIAKREPLTTDELATLEDGPELVEQLKTAARVFTAATKSAGPRRSADH